MFELAAGSASRPVTATVSPADGGRIASLCVAGRELLVTADDGPGSPAADQLGWGCYPMAPYAGRVRGGVLRFRGRTYRLPVNLAPHAIHGTGVTSSWEVLDAGEQHIEMECRLDWPFGGTAHQHVQLLDDALVCILTVVAGGEAMPVTVGWHPWFTKPDADRLDFTSMYRRDDEGIPTGELVEPAPRPWDDCFVGPRGRLELHYRDLIVSIASDCDHWVVYDRPRHATCVEPQSGPPDGANLGLATVLEPGEFVQHSMTVAWLPAGSV